MTTKTSHKIVTPFGTFTRTTARKYTHLVISTGWTVAKSVAHATAQLAHSRKKLAEYEGVIARNDPAEIAHASWCNWTVETWREFRDSAAADIAKHEAHLALLKTCPEPTTYGLIGFCGRADLAVKLASRTAAEGHGNVKVIDIATGAEV